MWFNETIIYYAFADGHRSSPEQVKRILLWKRG